MAASARERLHAYDESLSAPVITLPLLHPEQFSDTPHLDEQEMPPSKFDTELFELRTLLHNNASEVALLVKSVQTVTDQMTRLADIQARPPVQVLPAPLPKTAPWWLSPTASFLGLMVGVLGIKYIPTSTAVADKQMTMLEYRLNEAGEREKLREREMRLMQQYNMNLHLWFADHGIKGVPSPPKLDLDK